MAPADILFSSWIIARVLVWLATVIQHVFGQFLVKNLHQYNHSLLHKLASWFLSSYTMSLWQLLPKSRLLFEHFSSRCLWVQQLVRVDDIFIVIFLCYSHDRVMTSDPTQNLKHFNHSRPTTDRDTHVWVRELVMFL